MGVLQGIIKEEQERLESLIALYDSRLSGLPKGSLRIKGSYVYQKSREGSKTPTVYVGKVDSDRVREVSAQIEERRMYEERRKKACAELAEVRRALRAMAA